MLDIIRKILLILPPSDKWKFVGLLVLMLIGSFLEVLGIGMIPLFISIVASPERVLEMERAGPILEFFNIQDSGQLLVWGGGALIAVFIFKNAYILGFHYLEMSFLCNRYASVAHRLFTCYMDSPYVHMLSKNTSEILRNVTQETGHMVKQVIAPSLKLANDAILILGTLTLLLLVNPMITFSAVLLFAIAGGTFLRLIRSRARAYGRSAQIERKSMILAVNEGVGGLKDIRVLRRSEWFLRRFKGSISRYTRALLFRGMMKHATKPVLETVAVTGMLLIALVLYWQGRPWEMIVSLLALFGAATVRLLPAMREMVDAVNGLRFYGYSVYPVYEELKKLETLRQGETAVEGMTDTTVLPFERAVCFEDVSFFYPNTRQHAVMDLSITINKGEAVAFIGPSGAGKTTVVDLLLGILEPQRGRITVDGGDIRENHSAWLRNVGYIPQFIFLTDDTLRRNIALGLPDEQIDEARLAAAIEAAQLEEMVKILPNGLDTVVGERGARLSGGQRQRVGIARALYGNPSVLIMDEATSALDSETERCIIRSIERLKGERTIVMIAHRLSTVRNCDRLFMMNQGTVMDSGDFEELSMRNAELSAESVR